MDEASSSGKKGQSNRSEEKPGVAQKDLDKIAKLKEFMAKQQIDEKDFPKDRYGRGSGGRHRGGRQGANGLKNYKEGRDDYSRRDDYNGRGRGRGRGNNREKDGRGERNVGRGMKTGERSPSTNRKKVGHNDNYNHTHEHSSHNGGGARLKTNNSHSRSGPPAGLMPTSSSYYSQESTPENDQWESNHHNAENSNPNGTHKNEQKRSLDFIKNFFDNDPEVQYHRKLNSDSKDLPSPSADQGNGRDGNHRQVKQTNSQRDHNIENRGPAQYQKQNYNSNRSDERNAMGHISAMSNSNSFYHHGHLPSESFQGSNSYGLAQMTQAQLEAALSNLPPHLHQDLYAQLHQMSLMNGDSSNFDAMTNFTQKMPPGMNGYHNYDKSHNFPDGGNHQYHRAEEKLDPNTVSEILQKSKAWQEKALNKCGPIDSSQARSLIEQLIDDTYECMVCCETIKWNNQVWSCSSCYHVFHLACIRKWARSESAAVKDESGWRCPGCQNVSTRPPNKYYCFCGKVRDPVWNPRAGITPHSCGEVCGKKRTNPPCDHGCNELCHPGPCPTCPVMVAKHCPCGKTITKDRCGQSNNLKCENVCSKLLSCGTHRCQMKCHPGDCTRCTVKQAEECFCGKDRHYVVCGTNQLIPDEIPGPEEKCQKVYTCKQKCKKKLLCGNHECEDLCHPGECKPCPLLPENVTLCPCGKHRVATLLSDGESRNSCLDPIPTCESFCGKKLSCGPKGLSHLCMMKCHVGKCQPCQKVTTVQCRCGATKKEISCVDLKPNEDVLCERKCSKKRKCGRHKCNQKCCTDHDHACNIICGKKLSCGMHKCEEVCHTGFCPQCWRAGFDELSCHCGNSVLYPPIACGMKPPECDQPCARRHACGHPPTHTCHNEETCPPCTLLINKECMGGHEIWKNVPCHLSDVSCGRRCGKVLQCSFHKCIKTCHKGVCLDEGEICVQPCPVKRSECGHPCGARCHAGVLECPATPCKAQVTIRCRCGRKSANAFCLSGSVSSAYESFNSEILTSQLRNLQSGQSIDLSSMTSAEKKPKFLDCDEECSRLERNRKLAEALGIENPDGTHFQPTNFSSFLKQEGRTQLPFVQKLEEVLENLVTNAKKSSQSQIQHSLPPMNSVHRKIVHELSDVYGCKTYSLDPEPKRNTVVVASKESFIPQVKLSSLVEREIMAPNPPQPVMLGKDGQNFMVLGPQLKPLLKKAHQTSAAAQPKVDYFDDNFN